MSAAEAEGFGQRTAATVESRFVPLIRVRVLKPHLWIQTEIPRRGKNPSCKSFWQNQE